MERVAVFVDAGYVFAQGGVNLAGAKVSRTSLILNIAEVLNQFKSLATAKAGRASLLRIYWYDGAKLGPTTEQIALAESENVKVRLGTINSVGQQKGVDSLLVTDLIDLARNNAISDALIVTGDGDLRIAVQIAQSFGVRVHLIGLEPCRGSQSRQLMQEADTTHEIGKLDIGRFLTLQRSASTASQSAATEVFQPPATAAASAVPVTADSSHFAVVSPLQMSMDTILGPLGANEISTLKTAIGSGVAIPMEYDRKFLGTCKRVYGRMLTDEERREARQAFSARVRQL